VLIPVRRAEVHVVAGEAGAFFDAINCALLSRVFGATHYVMEG
jgi:hypothetical protein